VLSDSQYEQANITNCTTLKNTTTETAAPQLLTGALGNVSGSTTLCDLCYVVFSPRGYRTLPLHVIKQPIRHDRGGHHAKSPRLSRIYVTGCQAPLFLCSKVEQDKSALENQHTDWMAVPSIIGLKVAGACERIPLQNAEVAYRVDGSYSYAPSWR
jgi:hypothetical protein